LERDNPTAKVKSYKSPGGGPFETEWFQEEREKVRSERHNVTNSVRNKEELREQGNLPIIILSPIPDGVV
jgi:hypothetical protein